jgi:aldehyde:ferredoxin oxidoreductase
MGKILRIDLSARRHEVEPLPERYCEQYLGGNGFVARLLYDELKPGTDALSPDNLLIFATGPINSTMVPMSTKFCIGTKSPLTGGWLDSLSSGRFGCAAKYAGYDVVVVSGASDTPVYVFIDDDRIEFHDASHLWGENALETQERLRKELGDATVSVASIGPAGENLVRYACVMADQRGAGGGGAGAVMGSKKLKALVARGTKRVEVADPRAVVAFAARMKDAAQKSPAAKVVSTLGTTVMISVLQRLGGLPTRNWQEGVFEGAKLVSGEELRDKYSKGNVACFACFTPCGNYDVVETGPYAGTVTIGPETQGMVAFGSLVGNSRLDALIRADRLSDELGLGEISSGACIAFAMECFERGLLTLADTDGLDLRFGNHEAMLEMLRKIAYREGFGNVLAEGVKRAAEIIGRGTERYAMHVKGQEMSALPPRVLKTQAIGFAVTSKGGMHTDIRPIAESAGVVDSHTIEGKGAFAKELSDWTAIANSLIYCLSAERLLAFTLSPPVLEMIKISTGMDMTMTDVVATAERIMNVERAFNLREGFRRRDDTLPRRILTEPIPAGPAKGERVTDADLARMIDDYYDARGWDQDGIPRSDRLHALSMDGIDRDLDPVRVECDPTAREARQP